MANFTHKIKIDSIEIHLTSSLEINSPVKECTFCIQKVHLFTGDVRPLEHVSFTGDVQGLNITTIDANAYMQII